MVPISDLMQNGTDDWQRAKIIINGCANGRIRTKCLKAEQTTTTSIYIHLFILL